MAKSKALDLGPGFLYLKSLFIFAHQQIVHGN